MAAVYNLYSVGPDGGKVAFIRQTISHFGRLAKSQLLKEYPQIQVEITTKQRPDKLRPDLAGAAHP